MKRLPLMWCSDRRRVQPDRNFEEELREADRLRVDVLTAFGFENKAAVIVILDRLSPEELSLLRLLPRLVQATANEIRGCA